MLLGAGAAASLVLAGVTLRLFVWPASDQPRYADAVFVLSGDHGERLAAALPLVRNGVARTLVLDGEPDFALARDICAEKQPFEVICLRPRPDSTRAEARAAGRLAVSRRWRLVVVVTSTVHVTRAGLWFRRCAHASVQTVEARRRPGFRAVAHEWLGVAYALTLARSC